MTTIEVINDVIEIIESNGIGFIGKLGVFEKEISDGVNKYASTDSRVTHFIVFINKQALTDASFYCNESKFMLKELESTYGPFKAGYNFRENYTQLTFPIDKKQFIESIYFIKDNKLEIRPDSRAEETTPKGNKTIHDDISFDAFCIKFKDL